MKGLAAPLLAVVAVSVVLYARTLGFSFAYLDDQELVVDDQAFLTRPGAVGDAFGRAYFQGRERDHAYYRPIVTASFALDARTSGEAPAGYRATNLLLHAAAACLLFLVLASEGYSRGIALVVSLVFAVHPALTSAVAWIPGRDDILLGLFSLAAWLALLRLEAGFRPLPAASHGLCFFLALASKEAAVALPVVFVVRKTLLEARPIARAVPYWLAGAWAVAALAVTLLRRWALGPDLGLPTVGAASLLGGMRALVTGLGSLVLPLRPRLLAVPADLPLWPGCVALALLLALFALPGLSRRRLLFALVAFVVCALPSLPASNVLVLESRLYLPALALAFGAAEIGRCLPLGEGSRSALGAAVVVGLFALSWRTVGDFSDRRTLASALVRGSPHSSLAQRNLGVAEQLAGNAEAARRAYRRALAADPAEPLVHNNLAVLLMAEGKLAEAERELAAELRLHEGSKIARENLTLVERALGKTPAPRE